MKKRCIYCRKDFKVKNVGQDACSMGCVRAFVIYATALRK